MEILKTINKSDSSMSRAIPEEKLEAETVALFNKQLSTMLPGILFAVAVTFIVFWNVVPDWQLITWTLVVIALTIARIVHSQSFPGAEKIFGVVQNWKFNFILLSGLSGVLWGYIGFYFFLPESPLHQIFLTFALLAMTSASVNSLSVILPAYYAFIIPSQLPLMIVYFSLGDTINQVISIAILTYTLVHLIYAKTLNKSIRDTLQLRFENLELVEQLQQHGEKLLLEKEKAEKANKDKSRFLASASHDLRQPLHSLGLFLGTMEHYVRDKEVISLLDKSNRSLQSLQDLLDSLLDVSKLDAGVIEVKNEHFQISSIFEKLKTEMQSLAINKGLDIKFHCKDQILYTDQILLLRCLRNLVLNSIQQTQSGRILVACRTQKENVLIQLYDTGSGIPETELEKIFEEFYQLNNPERDRRKGLGLGLTIVKRLTDLLDCEINVRSESGKGTCFSIIVPKGDESKIQLIKDTSSEYKNKDVLIPILIIDDEIDVLDALSSLLLKWGYEVETAESINEADEKLSLGFVPELVITDYRLRDHATGLDAINKINEVLNKKVDAVIMTGDTSPDRIKEANADGYPILHKPVTPALLRSTLRRIAIKNNS
jgi:two-component system, sensor histidine kinase